MMTQQHPKIVDGWIDAKSAMPPKDTLVMLKFHDQKFDRVDGIGYMAGGVQDIEEQNCEEAYWRPIKGIGSPCGSIRNGMLTVSAYRPQPNIPLLIEELTGSYASEVYYNEGSAYREICNGGVIMDPDDTYIPL